MAIAYGKQSAQRAAGRSTRVAGHPITTIRRPLSHQVWVYFAGAILVTTAVLAALLGTGVLTFDQHMPIVLIIAMVGSVVGSMAAFFFIPGLFLLAAKRGSYQSRGLVVATDRNGGMENYHYNQRAIIRVHEDGQEYL